MTGTPAAYTKRLERWPAHLLNLADGGTADGAARIVGVSPRTILRWRQRTFATLLQDFVPACGGGRVEVARSGMFHYPPHIIAVDEADRSFIEFVRWNAGPWILDPLLAQRLEPGSVVICRDRPDSPFARAVKRAGMGYIRAERRPCPTIAGPHETDARARRLNGEFLRWHGQFRGVWDRHARHYALWFELRRRYPDRSALMDRVLLSWRPPAPVSDCARPVEDE